MWTAGRKFDVQEPRLPQPHSGVSAKELYIGLTYQARVFKNMDCKAN